jgi:RNA polymerase sigma-70 factor (ECF subfamily)
VKGHRTSAASRRSTVFLEAVPQAARGALAGQPDLEESLETVLRQAREAWPQIALADEVFLHHLARCSATAGANPQKLLGLQIADLYLACASAAGDRDAQKAFDRSVLVELGRWLSRRGMSTSDQAELLQELRVQLLSPPKPKLANYGGRGPLRTWVRLVAQRTQSNRRRGKQAQGMDPLTDNLLLLSPDPELQLLAGQAQKVVKMALREALAALTSIERELLRLQYVDGLSLRQLADALGTPRSTLAYQSAGARERLLQHTREHVKAELKLRGSELESLLRLVRSKLDVSLPGMLRSR